MGLTKFLCLVYFLFLSRLIENAEVIETRIDGWLAQSRWRKSSGYTERLPLGTICIRKCLKAFRTEWANFSTVEVSIFFLSWTLSISKCSAQKNGKYFFELNTLWYNLYEESYRFLFEVHIQILQINLILMWKTCLIVTLN